MRYVYSVGRFVPDPARDEAINIGIIAGSDENGEWALRTVGNYSRARRLDDRELLPSVRERLDRIEALIDPYTDVQASLLPAVPPETVDEAWLTRLSVDSANILQFTHPLPVVAESAEDAIDILWDELIVDPTQKSFRFAKKSRAVSAFAHALRANRVPDQRVIQKTTVKSSTFRAPMDFAIHNGNITHLANCWSFQLPNKESLMEEITSWAWAVRDLRKNGGIVANENSEFRITDGEKATITIYVIYVPPAPGEDADERAFESARVAFEDSDVLAHPVPASEADRVARDAARRLGIS